MPTYDDRWLFFEKAKEECQFCGKKMIWENRGRKGKGAWEIHHHPPKAGMNRTFRGILSPDTIMFLRVICWECHRKTLGSNFPDMIDYLR